VRLFVALGISSAIRERFTGLTKGLRAQDAKSSAKKPRWVRPENLHVTLKFIGETSPERLDAIGTVLAEVHSAESAELRFRGLGFFPDARRPRVLWARIDASPGLTSLAGDIDQRLAKLGFPVERRAFTPHLTLARCEPSAISAELRAAMEREAACDFGVLRTSEFRLIESKLKPTGAEYTTLKSFLFASA
jgi:2'-5' RNA ligase